MRGQFTGVHLRALFSCHFEPILVYDFACFAVPEEKLGEINPTQAQPSRKSNFRTFHASYRHCVVCSTNESRSYAAYGLE